MKATPELEVWKAVLARVNRTSRKRGSMGMTSTILTPRRTLWWAWRAFASSCRTSRVPALAKATATLGGIMLLLAVRATAQQTKTLDPNSIMGFEALGTWTASGNASGFTATITGNRTQGNAAYAISNPPNLVKIVSQPISSTAAALAGIGNTGATLKIDLLIPIQQGNPINSGWIQPYVTSNSRGLSKVPLAQVYFNPYREGIYNTISFVIPQAVANALKGATYSDLTFEFDINSPGKITGAYLLDNLRVHSVPLIQSPAGTPPPPGYGGSVNLVVYGNDPVLQSFTLGPTQIPNGFHLKMGTVGTTTVDLKLGLDGSPTTDCTYDQDGSDATERSYVLLSCTGGFKAGDLINANWLNLAIVGGDDTQKIRAQIAQNPLGDQIGAGLLPPMPTFWGDADTCIPSPVAGVVVTTTQDCVNQTVEANGIINKYFNAVSNSNPSPNWIVPPTPEFALRSGDGSPHDNTTGPPPTSTDPPFDDSGDLNPGGSFDAYWRLSGNLNPTSVQGTNDTTTHFDATFTTHGVIFGDDIDVMDVKVTADNDSGETTPTYKAASSTGTLGFYVFGEEIPSNGYTVNPSTGFSVDPKWSQDYDLPPFQIWIFSITLGASASAELNASGSAAVAGLDLSVTPSATLGAHAKGGINLGLASGTVDAKVNLVNISTPTTAQAKWVINTAPEICAATLNGSLNGNLALSSGGGEVDLDATFGVCPFCYTDTETLFKWNPLLNKNWTLFNYSFNDELSALPASLCAFPITVAIATPAPGATLNAGLPVTLLGSAAANDSALATSATYQWTYTPGANAGGVTVDPATANTATPVVTFGAPTSGSTSTWTIGMSATVSATSSSGVQLTSTGTATPITINVTNLTNGVYISNLVVTPQALGTPITVSVNNGYANLPQNPGSQATVNGLVVGANGTLNTTFTEAVCTDGVACQMPCSDATKCDLTALTTANSTSPNPSAIWNLTDNLCHKITMTTTVNGNPYNSASAIACIAVLE